MPGADASQTIQIRSSGRRGRPLDQFLMTREITHMKAFALALESMGKPAFSIGRVAPTPGLVNQYFNDSTGAGDHGELDTRGPWNEGDDWDFVESPAIQSC